MRPKKGLAICQRRTNNYLNCTCHICQDLALAHQSPQSVLLRWIGMGRRKEVKLGAGSGAQEDERKQHWETSNATIKKRS